MAPVEAERKKEVAQQGPLCCALPPLPTLPKPLFNRELDGCLCAINHLHSLLNRELDGCVCAVTHLQSIVSKRFDSLKNALICNARDAALKHPHLSRLLPPQFLSCCLPQLKGSSGKRHELAAYNFAAVLPGDSVAAIVVSNGILNFLNIYNTLLVVRLILTWFPEPPQVIVNPLSTICDPYLNIFRGIIPPLGGTIDLSPILAFLVLNVFTNSAAALPAELPSSGTADMGPLSAERQLLTSTHSQKAWIRRLAALVEGRKGTLQSLKTGIELEGAGNGRALTIPTN
ncbi:hypothetical protein GOP47_0007269 [Adiantum capillus-veneris]|uniref:Uncharacterized protein n=1 Tax=Adiantum capillus-veneris TaxID=13818 RepID=A0A9D4V0D1_ADICA|nr:hypothetical protein GOP47_0007269 [Adiantum capillus-veneris]